MDPLARVFKRISILAYAYAHNKYLLYTIKIYNKNIKYINYIIIKIYNE